MKSDKLRLAPARPRERGFTLIELMVASTIALFMLIGVSGMYLSTVSSESTNQQASEVTTNGRYAIDTLRRELMHAGFRGVTWAAPTNPTTTIGAITGDCTGNNSGFATNIRQGIWGSNDNNPFSADCIPTANYARGDVMVVRHAALSIAAQSAVGAGTCSTTGLSATKIYFRSAYERGEVFLGSGPPPLFTQVPCFDYELQSYIYYISPYTNSAAETPLVPALVRLTLGAGPTMTREIVASNVENMQVRYGRFTTDLNTQFYQANSVSTTATGTTTTPTEWDAVNSVRIWLLLRSTKPETGYKNTSTYILGDQSITVNDGYRRELYTTVVQLRNI